MIKPILDKVFAMDQRQRMARLCTLATKDEVGILEMDELIELAMIQAIRRENGEHDKVKKQWKEDGVFNENS